MSLVDRATWPANTNGPTPMEGATDRSAWVSDDGPIRVRLAHEGSLYKPPSGWRITGVQRFERHTNVLLERVDDE